MINLMLQDRQPVIYGDGEQKRSFSDVDDCIYCIDKLATDPNIKSQLVNIGPGPENEITINKLYQRRKRKTKTRGNEKIMSELEDKQEKAPINNFKSSNMGDLEKDDPWLQRKKKQERAKQEQEQSKQTEQE